MESCAEMCDVIFLGILEASLGGRSWKLKKVGTRTAPLSGSRVERAGEKTSNTKKRGKGGGRGKRCEEKIVGTVSKLIGMWAEGGKGMERVGWTRGGKKIQKVK